MCCQAAGGWDADWWRWGAGKDGGCGAGAGLRVVNTECGSGGAFAAGTVAVVAKGVENGVE